MEATERALIETPRRQAASTRRGAGERSACVRQWSYGRAGSARADGWRRGVLVENLDRLVGEAHVDEFADQPERRGMPMAVDFDAVVGGDHGDPERIAFPAILRRRFQTAKA